MRAGLRLGIAVLAAGLVLGPAPLRAQSIAPPPATTTPTTNTPATDAIGPKELQNFSLQGTVTRPAEPLPEPRGRPPAVARAPAVTAPPRAVSAAPREASVAREPAAPVQSASIERPRSVDQSLDLPPASAPSGSVTVALPPLGQAKQGFSGDSESLGAEHKLALWPWLLAALALGAGAAFLLWRRRSSEAFAGGPHIDAFSAPEAAPPRPAPAPPRPAYVPPPGLVSTRLRPWLDLTFEPLRCIVEDNQVTVEFELGLHNSGSAPARAVLVEASLFNAGPTQDREVGAFFAKPVGDGERIAVIPPLKHLALRTRVVAPRENVRLLDAGGRHVFVPLIGFNALYSWGSGEGQTSVGYLLGRDTKSEKLAPFRMDLGPRVFRALGQRPLPSAIRR